MSRYPTATPSEYCPRSAFTFPCPRSEPHCGSVRHMVPVISVEDRRTIPTDHNAPPPPKNLTPDGDACDTLAATAQEASAAEHSLSHLAANQARDFSEREWFAAVHGTRQAILLAVGASECQ